MNHVSFKLNIIDCLFGQYDTELELSCISKFLIQIFLKIIFSFSRKKCNYF